MKIPAQLYQFKDESALVIVSGSYEARLFVAKEGKIVQKRFPQTPEAKYDRDTGSQSSFEHESEFMHEKFLHALRNDSFDLFIKERITNVYLLAPHYISVAIMEHALHPFVRQRVSMQVDGDYHYHHPTDIVKIITRGKKELTRQQEEQLREKLRVMENNRE